GTIRQIVGVPGVGRKFHFAATIEIIDDLRPGLEIGVTALVGGSTNHRLEISLRGSDIIRKTGFATLPGAGHPDRTGRGRGGAANAVGFFTKQHIKTLESAHQGCRHAGCPSADNKRVDLNRGGALRRTWRGDRQFPLPLSHCAHGHRRGEVLPECLLYLRSIRLSAAQAIDAQCPRTTLLLVGSVTLAFPPCGWTIWLAD